jgi:hypothetical protein
MDETISLIPKVIRGAQYVRMSTEHQQYSTNNQADKILEYAQTRGIEIVKTYADEGKSGLSIGGRAALTQLIADVEAGNTDFTVILVYDISRWGRFQDTDERPIMSTFAGALASKWTIVPSSSTMMDHLHPPLLKASKGPWPANTAASCLPKCLQGNAGLLNWAFDRVARQALGCAAYWWISLGH